jgi:regulator of protease activity HflC (stomatin/prohibitin superfamily)
MGSNTRRCVTNDYTASNFKLGFRLGEPMKSVLLTVWVMAGLFMAAGISYWDTFGGGPNDDAYYKQLSDDDSGTRAANQIKEDHWKRNTAIGAVAVTYGAFGLLIGSLFIPKRWFKTAGAGLFVLTVLPGCGYRPFEPVELEVIKTNEEAFLIPLSGDSSKQASVSSEDFLRKNMVLTKQVKIPQQWVPKGYETWGANGNWKQAATLIRVDRAPVTREWTADTNSGTSNKNEAVWVMTSDQVEFSTGWSITARIATRDDAVVFLGNYPNGSLSAVLDQEVRAKIQTEFGLEVTDLPMDELRKSAAPHITKVVGNVEEFFKKRGVSITNLGITGGFVYKDKSIQDMLVKVFNAEQEKNISIAKTQAQTEDNKRIQLEADSKGKAIMTEKQAEAKGIQSVADAKAYEIKMAKEDLSTYLKLKELEVQNKQAEKWDGKFPVYFMGHSPSMLFQAPQLPVVKNP